MKVLAKPLDDCPQIVNVVLEIALHLFEPFGFIFGPEALFIGHSARMVRAIGRSLI
jgi:hypothetical protein